MISAYAAMEWAGFRTSPSESGTASKALYGSWAPPIQGILDRWLAGAGGQSAVFAAGGLDVELLGECGEQAGLPFGLAGEACGCPFGDEVEG
jgi:hypothetical protein